MYIDAGREVDLNSLYEVIVISNGKQWVTNRTFHDFTVLDNQIHYCVFDRKFSNLPVLKDSPAQVSLLFSWLNMMTLLMLAISPS